MIAFYILTSQVTNVVLPFCINSLAPTFGIQTHVEIRIQSGPVRPDGPRLSGSRGCFARMSVTSTMLLGRVLPHPGARSSASPRVANKLKIRPLGRPYRFCPKEEHPTRSLDEPQIGEQPWLRKALTHPKLPGKFHQHLV